MAMFLLSGCYYSGTVTILDKKDSPVVHHYKVEKVYPINGKNWNNYVKNSNKSIDQQSQPDLACDADSTMYLYNDCFHGAEKLKVNTHETSCTNLTLSENLGVFIWYCAVTNGEAVFFSGGLKDGKGLRDLITSAGWKNNYVTVLKNASPLFSTDATGSESIWWDNQIQPLPDNSGVATYDLVTDANGVGIIYYINTDTLARVFRLHSYNSLVSLNGAKLKPMDQVATTASCTFDAGYNKCFVEIPTGNSYIWIETDFEQTATSKPQDFIHSIGGFGNNNKFLKIINSKFTGNLNFGMYFTATNSSIFQNIEFSGLQVGVRTNIFFLGNILKNIVLKNVTNPFSFPFALSDCVFQSISIYSGSTGIRNPFFFSNSNFVGISTFQMSSKSFDGGSGYDADSNSNVLSLLAVNTTGPAISLDSVSNFQFSNIAITNSATAINITNVDLYTMNNRFSGTLLLGNNTTNCTIDSNNTALINNTCADTLTDGSTTYTGSPSTAILRTNRTAATSFIGKITTDDTANSSDTLGQATFASIAIDQFNTFLNSFRSWGKDGTGILDSTARSACIAGNTCRIYDYSLKNTDTTFRNISYDGANQNSAFVSGTTCPIAVNGNETISDYNTTPIVYLRNAWEIIGDGVGNDNGLCESGENCIYTPNIGAYQGHGDYWTNECIFQNGTVSNVRMFAYPTNGF